MNCDQLIEQLNDDNRDVRLEAASLLADKAAFSADSQEVNNHVHTIYSFSPYSPTKAAYMARKAGLQAVGCMDHDSVAGCAEMLEAGKSFGIATTVGFELRVNMAGTSFEGRKFNSPDSANIVYMAVHGIPVGRLGEVAEFLAPVNAERNKRNRLMVDRLNRLTAPLGLAPIDFEKDVFAISKAAEGGCISERHLLFALAAKVIEHTGKGEPLIAFLEDKLSLSLSPKIKGMLSDLANPHYEYDLLGIMKSSFLPQFFIQPDFDECIPVGKVIDFALKINAIPAYAYLGDVTDSPTGDKKAEKFEDDILDDLIPELKKLGFKAVTYMPPRNTVEQLLRVRKLCEANGLMEISGVDINSSRQTFNCPELLKPEFTPLIDATWALITHEKLAGQDEKYALFNPDNPLAGKPLDYRLKVYAEIGRNIDVRHPEKVLGLVNF